MGACAASDVMGLPLPRLVRMSWHRGLDLVGSKREHQRSEALLSETLASEEQPDGPAALGALPEAWEGIVACSEELTGEGSASAEETWGSGSGPTALACGVTSLALPSSGTMRAGLSSASD